MATSHADSERFWVILCPPCSESDEGQATFDNGYLFNNRCEMHTSQSTSYLLPATDHINQAVEDHNAFTFIHKRLASRPWKHSHRNAHNVPHTEQSFFK